MEQLRNNNYSPSDSIEWKHWVSTDRIHLEDNGEDFDDFLAKLLSLQLLLKVKVIFQGKGRYVKSRRIYPCIRFC